MDFHKEFSLQHKGGTEIIKDTIRKGLDFLQECRCTLIEKNEQTLDIIISRPGMQDTKYKNIQDSSAVNNEILFLILKYEKIAKMKDTEISYEKYKKGNDKYTKITTYLNKELYDKLEAQHNKK